MARGGAQSSAGGRREGLELLRQVYAELYQHLGDTFSPAELLQAAQTLIDVSRDEYADAQFQDGQLYPNYYSQAVDLMIVRRPWWLASIEEVSQDELDERRVDDDRANRRLRRYFGPFTHYRREYW